MTPQKARKSENANPNVSVSSPSPVRGKSPSFSSAKSKKPTCRIAVRTGNLPVQERKFVVAKKNSRREAIGNAVCKCKDKSLNLRKCPCVAYESLRASQEEFFKNRSEEARNGVTAGIGEGDIEKKNESEKGHDAHSEIVDGNEFPEDVGPEIEVEEFELLDRTGSSRVRKIRQRLLEEARSSIPESGSGHVKHLVKAFERLLTIPCSSDSKAKDGEEEKEKVAKWALPGLQLAKARETALSSSSFPPPAFVFSSKGSDIGSSVSSSMDSTNGRRASAGGRRSRRDSSSSGGAGPIKWKKQLKSTKQQPFNLHTEQRGILKKGEFQKKVEEMFIEEKKLRIPIAQGLPWTTDEPECLVKPPVKESTKPLDVQLHSDVRAAERAEFDHHVTEKLSLMEQYKSERERQQKLEEEEEIKRMRRQLIPRAQPMPYFDRPFIPKRSEKLPTIPKEPKFHVPPPHHKKIRCMSLSDMNSLYPQDLTC